MKKVELRVRNRALSMGLSGLKDRCLQEEGNVSSIIVMVQVSACEDSSVMEIERNWK
jgi:hypothetical protein